MDEEEFDEFYEKFDGYTIPRRKAEKREAESQLEPGEISDSEEKSKKPKEKKSNGYDSYSRSSNYGSSPTKHKRVISQSVSDFLRDERERSDDTSTYEISSVTYGDFKGSILRKNLAELWQSLYEEELPYEIVSQFKDSECGICRTPEFSHPMMARQHYAGQKHRKKVTDALQEWVDLDPLNRVMPKLKTNTDRMSNFCENRDEDDEKYCKTCEIKLSSKIVASTHYAGKTHTKNLKKRAEGLYVPKGKQEEAFPSLMPPERKKPKLISDVLLSDKESRLGSGNRFFCLQCKLHFNSGEKYYAHLSSSAHKNRISGEAYVEDTTPRPSTPTDDGNFTMTSDEIAELQARAQASIPARDSIDDMLSRIRADPTSAYDCSICQVNCTNQEQLQIHQQGKRHQKKLTALSLNPNSLNPPPPSGFRCEVCNIETSDQNGLDMHLQGKKHKKKVASML